MNTLEQEVENFLKRNGISKTFFARLIGISAPNLAAMFKGKRRMKATELIIFSRYFGLNLDFFEDIDELRGCSQYNAAPEPEAAND